jgi:prepilin-type N-terminal cleavage/methylation domain-containing protein
MNRASHRGYTLIELLVAITLAAIVAAVGAAVLRAGINYHARATRQLAESEHLRAADRLLGREWSRRVEQDLVALSDRIEFRTDRLYGAGAEGAARVRYLCSTSETGAMTLERELLAPGESSQQPAAKLATGAGGSGWRVLHTEVLLPQLTACGFSYLRSQEGRDARFALWKGEPAQGQPVPRLLRLRLATERGDIAPLVYRVSD